MSRRLTLMLTLAATLAAGIATADPVADRQAAMKQMGGAMRGGMGLASGQTPWDAAAAKAAADAVSDAVAKLKGLFPAGSDAGPDTEALPAIWANRADFDARLTALGAAAAAAGKAQNAADFQTTFKDVGGSCRGCHDLYRKKKS